MKTSELFFFSLRDQSINQKSTVLNFPVIPRRIAPGEQNPRHWHQHDCLEIAVITDGTAMHILNNQSAPIQEGDVLLIGPNLVHGYEECGGLGMYNVLYDPTKLPVPILDGMDIPIFQQFLPAKFEEPRNFTPKPIAHFSTREALDAAIWKIDQIHYELTTISPGNMFAGFAHLLDFLATLLRLVEIDEPVPVPAQQWIFPLEETLSYLNKNYARHITLPALMKMSNLSRRNFQYKFKRLTGHTLTDYLLRKRLAEAKAKLLQDPNASILGVAFDCGFEDAGYFTRQFRKAFGVPPGRFRRDFGNSTSRRR